MKVALYRKDMTFERIFYCEIQHLGNDEDISLYEIIGRNIHEEHWRMTHSPSDFYIKTDEGFLRVYIEK